jgi:hypothetical protein
MGGVIDETENLKPCHKLIRELETLSPENMSLCSDLKQKLIVMKK